MTLTALTVTGTYQLVDGSPASGQIEFNLTGDMQDAATKKIVIVSTVIAPLVNGSFSLTLYANDNSTTQPAGVAYQVVERITGSSTTRSYQVVLPSASPGGTVDLSSLAPALPASPAFNYLTVAAADAKYLTPAQASGTFAPLSAVAARTGYPLGVAVANRTWSPVSQQRTLNAPGTSKSSHFAAAACTDLRLVYANWTVTQGNGSGDTDNTNASALPIRAAIEYPSGTVTPVFFNGSRTALADNGATPISDPVAIEIPAGAQFWVRTYLNPAAGDSWPTLGNSTSNTEGEGFGAGDLTASGAAAIARSDSYLYRPVAIFGRTGSSRSIGIVGDSIAAGQGDTTSLGNAGAPTLGFIARACTAASLPWTATALPSETAGRFVSTHFRRGPLLGGCTTVISNYGVNDLAVALNPTPTLAILQAAQQATWAAHGVRGAKVFQTTITPFTTSTDSFATTANQTIDASRNSDVRIALNTWLRDGAPTVAGAPAAVGTSGAARCAVYSATGVLVVASSGPSHALLGVFDAADAVESARNSGLWKPNYTGDGLHPKPAGHAAMSGSISISALA